MAQDARQVRILCFDELEQQVLQLNIIIGARQTKTSRRFKRAPAGVIKPADQGLQVYIHSITSFGREPEARHQKAEGKRWQPEPSWHLAPDL
jgi:hypothetical protein